MSVDAIVKSLSIDDLVTRRDAVVAAVRAADSSYREALAHAVYLGNGVPLVLHIEVREGLGWRDNARWFGEGGAADALVSGVDAACWRELMSKSGLLTFLDQQAKDEWERGLSKPPPFTAAAVRVTIARLYDERGSMFERGVVNVFRALSWDFKSNSPRKLGKKIILTGMTWGDRDHRAAYVNPEACRKLDDLIRVFAVLDGHPEPDHTRASLRQLEGQKWPRSIHAVVGILDPKPVPYIELKAHANGNMHATFSRPDLVDRVNLILAKHHPNALPPAAV